MDETKPLAPAIGPYQSAVRSGSLLFCSGQIPLDSQTGEIIGPGIEEQTHQVLKNLRTLLQQHQLTLRNVRKTACFLVSMKDFAIFNEIYAQYFLAPYPARSCVEVSALPKSVLVEIEAIAEFT